jgi:hypothetical protein
MSVIVRAPIAAAIEAPTFSGRFPMHAVDETIPFPPRYRAFDILRGPPSTFLD